MKTKYIIPALMLGALTSCNDLLDDVDFTVAPVAGYVYKAGEPVTFNFEGNPDYITFFSGEEGSNYKNRFRTEIAMEDIASAEFSFASKCQYGKEMGTMEVYFSDSFGGITKKDYQKDMEAIRNTNWTTAFSAQTLDGSSASAFTPMGPVDVSNYLNHFVVAFRYKGTQDMINAQRTWTINQFAIKCVLKSGKVIESGTATALNFAAFDMLRAEAGAIEDPYQFIVSGSPIKGTWIGLNISTNQVQLQGGDKTLPSNEDWLISTPLKLNTCTPDAGMALKDMTSRISSHTHTFEKPGTYEVVFVAGNANYQGSKEQIKKLSITIEE